MYRFQNSRATFYKYKAIDEDNNIFYTNSKLPNAEELDMSDIAWIQDIDFKSNIPVNALLKRDMNKTIAIEELKALLDRADWRYGKTTLDKINEYKLLGLETPLTEEEMSEFIRIRKYIYDCIEFYSK